MINLLKAIIPVSTQLILSKVIPQHYPFLETEMQKSAKSGIPDKTINPINKKKITAFIIGKFY